MSDTYLVLENLVKNFYDRHGNAKCAVDDISLNVKKGEFVTLLGPSGCGKTTTLRMIAGFERQNSGNIFVNGKNINNMIAFNRNMPMVFQSYALFPHLSIFENIAYGLRVRNMDKADVKNEVAMACQMVNLTGLEQRYPGELSGGQQQRVALARALVLKPEIILFDEPLSNLDAKLRVETRTEIKRMQKMLGITAIYVTHDQAEALSMSDKIVIMQNGKIVQIGDPEKIYNTPATCFVADFIGHVNFIPATISKTTKTTISVNLQNQVIRVPITEQEDFAEGEEVILSIRPEAISITTENTGFKGQLLIDSFLGTVTEYKVEFESSILTAVHSNSDEKGSSKMSMGYAVYIDFKKEFFRVYKKDTL